MQNVNEKVNILTGGHKRSAEVLTLEIKEFINRFGIENCGFLTLTFADDFPGFDMKEAKKRFHSLSTGILRKRYSHAIVVTERGDKNNRIHFHLVVHLGYDIRTGVDFLAIKNRDYRTASKRLRKEWFFWRETAPKYGFGEISELLPIRTNSEGIARYVGSYISKHIGCRKVEDKGARLVSYIGYRPGDRVACSKFSYNSPAARLWRAKCAQYCKDFNTSLEELKEMFGPKWCYKMQGQILDTVLENYQDKEQARLDNQDVSQLPDGATDIKYPRHRWSIIDIELGIKPVWPDWDIPESTSAAALGVQGEHNAAHKMKIFAWAMRFQDRVDGFKPERCGDYKNRVVEARQRWKNVVDSYRKKQDIVTVE